MAWLEEPELETCYVIHAAEAARVKIGCTKEDPVKRLKTFQTGCPVALDLVAVLEGGWQKEQELHRRFADKRMRGEWFDDSILPLLLAEA
jgi:hypothetical protein